MAKVLSDLEVEKWFTWSADFRDWAISNGCTTVKHYDSDDEPVYAWRKDKKPELVRKIVAIVKSSQGYSKTGHPPFGTDWNGVTA